MKHRLHIIIILLAVFFFGGFLLLRGDSYDDARFQEIIRQVNANDLLSTQFFTLEDDVSDEDYLATIIGGLELYRSSSQLLDEALALEGLPAVQTELAEDIDQYVDLRTEQFELLEESVVDNNLSLILDITALGERIENLEIYQQGTFIESLERQSN